MEELRNDFQEREQQRETGKETVKLDTDTRDPRGRVVNKLGDTDMAGWEDCSENIERPFPPPLRPAHAAILISVLHHFLQWDLVNLCTTQTMS